MGGAYVQKKVGAMAAVAAAATLQCQLLHPDAQAPTRAHVTDAGYDLYAYTKTPPYNVPVLLEPGRRVVVGTGVAVKCPIDTCWQIWPRSGWAVKKGVAVLAGLVDSGYRGEVQVVLQNHGTEEVVIEHGDRIAQLVPVSLHFLPQRVLSVVPDLEASDRGAQGFGSTLGTQ